MSGGRVVFSVDAFSSAASLKTVEALPGGANSFSKSNSSEKKSIYTA